MRVSGFLIAVAGVLLLSACGSEPEGADASAAQGANPGPVSTPQTDNNGSDPNGTPEEDVPLELPTPSGYGSLEEIPDPVMFRKDIVAIGFDVVDSRAVLRASTGVAEVGEPEPGTGLLKPPMGDGKDRPLPWNVTPFGVMAWLGVFPMPEHCANTAATIPQPAHGRWANPRDIVLEVAPGFQSVYVDDLDCSSGDVEIRKEVQMDIHEGGCTFVGPVPSTTRQEVTYPEPKGWSVQPNPVVFGGILNVPAPPAECVIRVQVLKKAANWPAEDIEGAHYQTIRVRLRSKAP